MRYYVKGLSCRKSRLCPRCGSKVEPSIDTLIKALIKLDHAAEDQRPGF